MVVTRGCHIEARHLDLGIYETQGPFHRRRLQPPDPVAVRVEYTAEDGKLRWWLVPLTWAWANLHGMWSVGIIIGIVAAKLLEKFHKPTFVLQEMDAQHEHSVRASGGGDEVVNSFHDKSEGLAPPVIMTT